MNLKVAIVFVLATSLLIVPIRAFAQGPRKTITLKLLNGETGHPVRWRGSPYVFLGNQANDSENFEDRGKRTNLSGELKIDVTGAIPAVVKVWVDFLHRDCRFPESKASSTRTFTYSGSTLAALPTYSIEEILKKGVVSENYCGSRRAAKPGILVIYVIPATYRELWNE